MGGLGSQLDRLPERLAPVSDAGAREYRSHLPAFERKKGGASGLLRELDLRRDGMNQYFIRLANARNLPRTLAVCVFLLALPSLGIGMQADDFVLAQRVQSHPLDAFMFMPGGSGTAELRERGILNLSTSHDLKLHFMRPLASLSHALDFALWPDAAWLMHLENAALYAALVWLAALVYAQVLRLEQSARLAAMFYAFSAAHATTVGWISSRNTIVSALLGTLTMLLFVRAPRALSRMSAAAVGVHGLTLLAGEAGTASFAPLLAYALTLSAGSWRARAMRVLPHVLLCAGYLLAYARLGYGAAHCGMYLNAMQQPWAFAQNFLVGVPLYLHSSMVVPHAGLAGLLPSGLWLLVALACLALATLLPWVLPVLRADARAQFFALSALGSILPLSAVTPQDRLGFFVGFGCCGLLAVCLTANDSAPFRSGVPRALFHIHTSGALLAFVPLCFVCRATLIGGGPKALNEALSTAADRDVVVLNVPVESAIVSVTAMRRQNNEAALRSIRALYVGGGSYDVRRVDARTIDVHVARAWFGNDLERIARDPRVEPFAPGDVETTDLLTAQVMEVDPRDAPVRVRFQFVRPLDDPRWLWLRFEGSNVLRWTPPSIGDVQPLAAAGLMP